MLVWYGDGFLAAAPGRKRTTLLFADRNCIFSILLATLNLETVSSMRILRQYYAVAAIKGLLTQGQLTTGNFLSS
jgi:hypothetical protein